MKNKELNICLVSLAREIKIIKKNIHNFLAKNSMIYIDDYNNHEVENGTLDFINKYSGKYTILKEVKTGFNMHPTYWNGFILFKKN